MTTEKKIDRKIKGVIFDMDGTLFDTEIFYQKFWKEIADEMGRQLDDAFPSAVCGSEGAELIRVINKYYRTTTDDDARAIFLDLKDRMKKLTVDDFEMKPGVIEILKFLKDSGIKAAIASSSARSQVEFNIKGKNIADYFDDCIGGDEISTGKPDPEIFIKAAEKIGLSPEECIVVEDSFNGVKGGAASGAFTIMVPDIIKPTDEIRGVADLICDSLIEVRDVIRDSDCI